MGVRKTEDRNVRSLFAVGYQRSVAVVLPIEHVRELGWKPGKEVVVKKGGKGLSIQSRR